MTELSIVGKRVPLIDAREKCTGRTRFATDIRAIGMLHGKILRSPHPHARVVRIDVKKAEMVPGVRAVVTAKDTSGARFGTIIPDEVALASDKVRFVGDEVAAVAAIDEEIAQEALSLIEVEYEVLPAVFDPLEAMAEGAPRLHEGCDNNVVTNYQIVRGDVEKAFRGSDFVVEERFTTSTVHQGYLEPVVCVAEFDASGCLTAQIPVQSAHIVREALASALSMSEGNIRLIQPAFGGGFGGKMEHKLHVICAFLAKKAGRAVRLVHSYAEDLAFGLPRVPMIFDLKLGANRDGTIIAKQTRIIADNGAYTKVALAVLGVAAMRADTMYRISNIKTEATLVYTNKVPTSTFRGFGNPQMTFALESLIDVLAERIGVDPVEIRLKNATHAGDTSAHGYIIRSCGLSDCIKSATASAGWREKKAEKKVGRGIGIACCVHSSSNRTVYPKFDGSSALVKIGEDGIAVVNSGEVDMGQGAKTVFAQITAEELGIPLNQVRVAGVDTEHSPFGIGSVSSRVTTLGGNAVKTAVEDARRQLFQIAAERLEANPDDLASANGRIFVRGTPDRGVSFIETVRTGVFKRGGAPFVGQGTFIPDNVVVPDRETRYGNPSSAYSFAAQVAEVEVDMETGQVKIVSFTAGHDIGKAINPMAVEGQIEGGVSQGIGYALTEDLISKNGQVQNTNLSDYRLPTSMDLPNVESILIETIDPIGPYGAKGIGEPALVPTAAAVANAICDATGVRITSLPITPEKILRALRP